MATGKEKVHMVMMLISDAQYLSPPDDIKLYPLKISRELHNFNMDSTSLYRILQRLESDGYIANLKEGEESVPYEFIYGDSQLDPYYRSPEQAKFFKFALGPNFNDGKKEIKTSIKGEVTLENVLVGSSNRTLQSSASDTDFISETIVYELRMDVSGEVLINNFLLGKTQYGNKPYLLIEFLLANPNERLSKNDILEALNVKLLDFASTLKSLHFRDDLKKSFFDQGKEYIQLHNPVTKERLKAISIDWIKLPIKEIPPTLR